MSKETIFTMERGKLQRYCYATVATLKKIEAISCGELQIEADGDYDDTDGLRYIYDEIQTLKKLME